MFGKVLLYKLVILSMKVIYLLFAFLTIYSPNLQSQEINKWLDKNIIPIKYVTAENGLEDLDPLDRLIGDARIVELGECTHGSSEIFSMKHRMLEYLVKEKGFTIFSIEANMPEAYALNEYIIDGRGDPKKLLAGMYFWTWNTQEVLNMIEWMKKYNKTSQKKIMFTGFDMQIPIVAIKVVRNYITIHQPQLLYAINNYDSLYLENAKKNNYKISKVPKLIPFAQNIIKGLEQLNSLQRDTSSSYLWALQNSTILLQFANMMNGKVTRDESMAVNVKWILEQNPNAKMVIWAHNNHVQKNWKFGKPMGYYLDKEFGNKMATIGFSTEEGTYTAVNRVDGKYTRIDSGNILLPSTVKDIEYYFKDVKADNFIVDLRMAKKDEQSDNWVSEIMRMRDIGARVMDKYQFSDVHLNNDFDMIIFLKRTSSSNCFSITKK